MIGRACIAGMALALALNGGCRGQNGGQEPIDERGATEEPTADNLARGPRGGGEERLEPREEYRAPERAGAEDRRVDPNSPVAIRQDLQRAVEDADRRIQRVRASEDLTEGEADDLDALERRLREVRQDLDALQQDPDADWLSEGDHLRSRVRRINRAIDRVEDRRA